jgi:hypothetical protein
MAARIASIYCHGDQRAKVSLATISVTDIFVMIASIKTGFV